MQHPTFGAIEFSHHDGWINNNFELWGFKGIALLVNGSEDGPSAEVEAAFRRFETQRDTLLPRCLALVEEERAGWGIAPAKFSISGLTITPGLWTLWFDLEGDDHFMYGVQTDDDWATLTGFADD